MEYYIDYNTKKVHCDTCWCTRVYKDGHGWLKCESLNEMKKMCKHDGRVFKYCGNKNCFSDKKKIIVK